VPIVWHAGQNTSRIGVLAVSAVPMVGKNDLAPAAFSPLVPQRHDSPGVMNLLARSPLLFRNNAWGQLALPPPAFGDGVGHHGRLRGDCRQEEAARDSGSPSGPPTSARLMATVNESASLSSSQGRRGNPSRVHIVDFSGVKSSMPLTEAPIFAC